MLDAELKPRLFAYMGGIFRELGGTALLINGPADHVHILAVNPATGVGLHFADDFRDSKFRGQQRENVNVIRWAVDAQGHAAEFAEDAAHVGEEAWLQFRVQHGDAFPRAEHDVEQ